MFILAYCANFANFFRNHQPVPPSVLNICKIARISGNECGLIHW